MITRKAPKRSTSRDRKLVSSQPHEVRYAGKTLGKGGTAAVKTAKTGMGRKTSRTAIMKKAKLIMAKVRASVKKK